MDYQSFQPSGQEQNQAQPSPAPVSFGSRKNLLLWIIFAGGVVLVGVVFLVFFVLDKKQSEINSFQDCVAAGYPVIESYPRQCNTPDGKHFIEDVDQTQDWQTYRNEKYGFEFKYPSDKFLVNPSDGIDYENTVLVSKTEVGQPGILIVTAMKKSSNNDTTCEKEVGTITIAGTVTKKCRASEPDDRWFGFLSSSQTDFRFDCWSPTQNDQICGQILSTFKFTDSADTSTWKTYTNTQYGFEFKYPSSGWKASIPPTENPFNFSLFGSDSDSIQIVDVLELWHMTSLGLQGNIGYVKSHPSNDAEVKGFETVNINGGVALYYFNTVSIAPGPTAYLISDRHIYLMDTNYPDPAGIFKGILSTFKFIE